jgi:proteasome lid subunit RPN8/RPN11
MSQKLAEKFDLVEEEKEKKILDSLSLIPFGPCSIDPQAWKRLKLAIRAFSTRQNPKEVNFALLGKINGERFLIKEIIQLPGETSGGYCTFSTEDLKKLEKEASKEELMLIGMLHTHCGDSSPFPSQSDNIAWLSQMFEFNRPLVYYIVSADSLRCGAYSIPPQIFYQLKEAIKFIPFEVKE